MAAYLMGLLGLNLVKISFKNLLKPDRANIVKADPPFYRLCVSAILAQLAYKTLQEFRCSARLVTDKYERVKEDFDKCIFQDEKDLVMIDGSKANPGMSLENEVECQDTQVFMWTREGMAYIVFRGTESKKDVLANLDVRRELFSSQLGVLVHRGFLNQFKCIEARMTEYLEQNRSKYSEVRFIGHSLGAACATIASLFYEEYFKNNNKAPIIHCHTFGGPRVGNNKFASYFSEHETLVKNTWQIKAFEDVVTMIPFSYRFCHIVSPTLYFHKGKMRYTENKKDSPWYFRPFLLITKVNIFTITAAHSLDKYIDSILKKCEV